jgi:hypothetical protein
VLLVAFTVAAISSVAVAAKAPIDFPGSTWATSGTATFHAKKAGRIKGPLFVDLTFGPTIVPSLSTSEVEMLLDDGMFVIPVSGTYSEKKVGKGKPTLTLNMQDFADAVLGLVLDAIGGLPPGVEVSLTIDKVKAKAKVKSISGSESMKIKFKTNGKLSASGPGGAESLNFRLSYSGKGPRVGG